MLGRVPLAGAILGLGWGAIATALFLAMFRELLPAIPEMPPGLSAIALVAVLPFQVAAGIAVLTGWNSLGLVELISLTLACGVALGVVLGAAVRAIRSRLVSAG